MGRLIWVKTPISARERQCRKVKVKVPITTRMMFEENEVRVTHRVVRARESRLTMDVMMMMKELLKKMVMRMTTTRKRMMRRTMMTRGTMRKLERKKKRLMRHL